MLNKRINLLILMLMSSMLMLGCSNKSKVVEENTNEVIEETVKEVIYETIEEKLEGLKFILEAVLQEHNTEDNLENNESEPYIDLVDEVLLNLENTESEDGHNISIDVLEHIDEYIGNIKENGFKMEDNLLGDI